MAINFEAANMAGYNNPKIEVFKAHANENLEIDSAPIKSDILQCLSRGCVPFIQLTLNVEGMSQHFLCAFVAARETAGNSTLSFTVTTSYGETGDPQTLALVYGNNPLPSLV